ncbi:hypothetical protein [Bacillus sp. USDA818B3_A]|uniref:hypothetical protein n=1 Tax=Bacillus sp. USDA818B3_A TaxID=2698834 RepID=UPI001371426A|nr:hypothetical protein [Bacillus sp. USDA818B3_A]
MYRLLKKMLITVVFVLSLVSCMTFGILGSALFQEGNPIPLLVSIVKLKLTDTDYVQFLNTEKQSRYLSSDTSHPPYKQVKEFMKSKGWDFEEQMGSGLIFLKDEKEALVMTRQYSKYFVIWDVSKSVIR